MEKSYRFKVRNRSRVDFNKSRLKMLSERADPVPLAGVLQGKRASDIEERFGRALLSVKLSFRFQVHFAAANHVPGRKKVVDFVVESQGMEHPVEIDGKIGHSTSAQQGRDAIRQVLLNEVFVKQGLALLQRVRWTELETQADADRTVRRMFL